MSQWKLIGSAGGQKVKKWHRYQHRGEGGVGVSRLTTRGGGRLGMTGHRVQYVQVERYVRSCIETKQETQ